MGTSSRRESPSSLPRGALISKVVAGAGDHGMVKWANGRF
jgi:hypothetical protein